MYRSRLAVALLALAFALPADARNPLQLFRRSGSLLGSECGWQIGDQFDFLGQRTVLSIQVFSGTDPGSPGFLTTVSDPDPGLLAKVSSPGMLIRLKGGTYDQTMFDGMRILRAGAFRASWVATERVKKAAKCGAVVAGRGGPTHLDFFAANSFLIAAPLVAREGNCDLFDAYYAGRPQQVVSLTSVTSRVSVCASGFLDGDFAPESFQPIVAPAVAAPGTSADSAWRWVPAACEPQRIARASAELLAFARALPDGVAAHGDLATLELLAFGVQTLAGECRF